MAFIITACKFVNFFNACMFKSRQVLSTSEERCLNDSLTDQNKCV